MPNVLDIFNDDAFGVVEMTKSVNLLPYQPSRLGQLGLFNERGITTTSVMIERQGNKLALLPSTTRGTGGSKRPTGRRDVRSLLVPHIPQNDIVLADDVQNVRAFDSDNTMQTVAGVVADRQSNMRQNHEVTEEFLRAGAIQGSVVDGDGSTVLHNLLTEFDVSRTTVAFKFSVSTTSIKAACMAVRRAVETALGGTTYTSIRGFAGNAWWDSFIVHADVEAAFDRYQDGSFLRENQRSFEFCGISFENYRGAIGDVPIMPLAECQFVVEGVSGLFETYYAPADYVETVNTVGRKVYSKQRRMEFDRGIEIETQSNPLPICTRPDTLIQGTST